MKILLVFLTLHFQNTLIKNLLFNKLGLNKLGRVFTACYFVLDTFANADEKLGERRGENRAEGAAASERPRRPLTAALRLQVAFPSQKKIGFIKNWRKLAFCTL